MATIGLAIIVKNEATVIRRCLESVRPLIDYCLVVDTGSTDGTQEVIRAYLGEIGLPGVVLERPWRDFADNRSEVLLELRKLNHIDYALTIDADEYLAFHPGFDIGAFKQAMQHDSYTVTVASGDYRYDRTLLLANRLPFFYRAVLHEYVVLPEGSTRSTASGFEVKCTSDGARSRNPLKYADDALVLEAALQAETDPFLISRYTFYLAQSYRDAGEPQKAIDHYLRRTELGFWVEEISMSFLYAAAAMEKLAKPPELIIATYLRAFEKSPRRAEALHGAARVCRMAGQYHHGYLLAKAGLTLPLPPGLFINTAVYAYRLLDEFQILAFWSAHYEEAVAASERLLEEAKFPESERPRIEANAAFALARLDEVTGYVAEPEPDASSPGPIE